MTAFQQEKRYPYKTQRTAMVWQHKSIFPFLWAVLLVQWGHSQFTIPPKPQEQTSVYDYADLLNEGQEKSLERKLIRYADTTSTQIVIAIIETLEGENIGLLTPRWAQKWGVGQAKEDNGIFILLAAAERRIWISPGYGAEEKLTAGIVGEITRNVIIPEFKNDAYYEGLHKGTSAIIEVLQGTYTNKGTPEQGKSSKGKFVLLVIVFVIIVIILSRIRNNRNGGGRSRRGLDLTDILILSSLGKGSFGGSSSGSGGFGGGFSGGFGGGGFSGGGAGGSW
ncbi:MAG: TPM domain-containing protein [Bacteroidota bacterium]